MRKYWIILTAMCFFLHNTIIAEEFITLEAYASYYGEAFNGRPTSSGEIFDMNQYTAAHKTLPFGTLLEVTNLENGKKVIVRVNDRGPFIANREIDLSKAAAESLGMINRGVTRVSIKKVDSLDHAAIIAANELAPARPLPEERINQGSRPMLESQSDAPMTMQPPISGQSEPMVVQPPVSGQPNQVQVPSNPAPVQPNPMPTVRSTEPVREERQEEDEPQLIYKATNSSETRGVLWRIQLGSFTREENALRLVVRLRRIGFEPAYEKAGKSIRVVLPGIRPADMKRVKEALHKDSLTDYIIRQEGWE